jgi:hypothetical protein
MSIQIQAVPRLHGPNIPGLAAMLVIPADALISMPEYFPDGELAEDPLMLDTATAYMFWLSDLSAEYGSRQRKDKAGPYYELEAEFGYAGPEEQLDAIMTKLRGRYSVLIAYTQQGKRILLGTKERPLRADIRKSSGSLSGLHGYRLSFAGQSLWAPPRFTGELAGGTITEPPVQQQMIDWSEFDFTNLDWY